MTIAARLSERRAIARTDPGNFTSGVHRYRDHRFNAIAVKIFPGEHYVTANPEEMLVTVLGSCVAACIRDPVAGVGGMNHFMLPEPGNCNGSGWEEDSCSMRYGNVAMEWLINDILARGGLRHRLEIKVFGGGNVMKGHSDIGHRNAAFVERYVADENLLITASHLRGVYPRRVHYFPVTGQAMVLELRRTEDQSVIVRETLYKSKIQSDPVAGSAELF